MKREPTQGSQDPKARAEVAHVAAAAEEANLSGRTEYQRAWLKVGGTVPVSFGLGCGQTQLPQRAL